MLESIFSPLQEPIYIFIFIFFGQDEAGLCCLYINQEMMYYLSLLLAVSRPTDGHSSRTSSELEISDTSTGLVKTLAQVGFDYIYIYTVKE